MTKELILTIHIIVGVIIFLTGLLQIILKKGGKAHRFIGRTYFYCWIFLVATGAYLGGLLITIIGIFGLYFSITGSRIGNLKNKEMTIFDKSIIIIGALISLSMIFYAVKLFSIENSSFGIVFSVFGIIFSFTTIKDISKYILKKHTDKENLGKLDWYFEHFFRMIISFVAAVTAFASIQNLFDNNTLNFLLPTLAGVIALFFMKKSYKKKFKIKDR